MEVYAGIDWAKEFHVLCVIEAEGRRLFTGTFPHSRTGVEQIIAKLKELQGDGHVRIGIELTRGSLVEALHGAGLEVLPVHPNHLASARDCFGAAGNKNDRKDAWVLAEVVRTSGDRLRQLNLGTEETKDLKRLDDLRLEVSGEQQRTSQRLAAVLAEVFPAAIGLFSHLECQITLAFLEKYPTAKAAENITIAKVKALFRKMRYSGGQTPEEIIAKLKAAAPAVAVSTTAEFVVRAQVTRLRELGKELHRVEKEIEKVAATHSLHTVYASLPGTATTTVANLIANLGDLAQYKTAEDLQAAAGLVPVVRQSGKSCQVSFRRACNKDLRRALTLFADLSRRDDEWAAGIYDSAIGRGKKHPLAARILARAWASVIFRMIKDRAVYDPERRKRAAAKRNAA